MLYDKELDYNYLISDNNSKVNSFSSQTKECHANNILSNDRKSIWLTETSLPQWVVIDIGNLIKKPKNYFKFWGIYCWHAYSTNPKIIEIFFSKDNQNYKQFGKYELSLKPGTQFFEIRNSKLLENMKYRFIKILVKESFGGNRTYINQIYFFEELSGNDDSNKITQISTSDRNRKNRSEGNSFTHINEEEDEDEDEREKPTHSEYPLRNHVDESEENNESNSEEDHVNDRIKKNKKIKKIKNILKSKIRLDKSKEDNSINANDSRRSKSFICNKNNDVLNTDYKRLEDQLKDMENQISKMGIEYKIDRCSYMGGHSKSFSILKELSNPFIQPSVKTDVIQIPEEPKSDNKISNLEKKIDKLEEDVVDMKININKLIETVSRAIDNNIIGNNQVYMNTNNSKQSQFYHNESYNNDMMHVILNECNKLINDKLNNYFRSETHDKYKSNYQNEEDDLDESLEDRIQKKIEQKFNSLGTTLETQIYNNFLKPSINTIENTMRNNIEEMKKKLKSSNLSNDSMSIDYLKSTSTKRNTDNKIKEITQLGETLYEKLLLKEKRLNDLKNETASYLKQKLKK